MVLKRRPHKGEVCRAEFGKSVWRVISLVGPIVHNGCDEFESVTSGRFMPS